MIHICNAFFEKELETNEVHNLKYWLSSSPIILQLQFLPLLYANKNDFILVSSLPENPDPRLLCLDAPSIPDEPLIDWGPSRAIASWAKEKSLQYSLPNWEMIRLINSKVFSFENSLKLPGSALLKTKQQLKAWLEKTPGPKVLKRPLGTAGSGNILNPSFKGNEQLPLIGEPWVHRICDFSSQWFNGKLLGITQMENSIKGCYKKTYVSEIESWALDEHLKFAAPLVEKILSMGYSGNLGIDAFIYLTKGEKKVHPIAEINARKTMGWVALKTPSSYLAYEACNNGLLPNKLETTYFKKNIPAQLQY